MQAGWYSQCVVSDGTMELLSIMNALSLVRRPNKRVGGGRRRLNTLPTAHLATLKVALFLNCTGEKDKRSEGVGRFYEERGEEERKRSVSPQRSSSRPSEQSRLKSHTFSTATHSPCDWQANIPSGQVCGWTVGAWVVTEGVVVFGLGSSPTAVKHGC